MLSKPSTSKGKGISLSRNNSSNKEEVLNINIFVESVCLKQPKVNVNYFMREEKRDSNNEPTERKAGNRIDINRSVYLKRNSSPGISLSLINKNNSGKENKVEYKRKSISIEQSKLFRTEQMNGWKGNRFMNKSTCLERNPNQIPNARKPVVRCRTEYD